MTAHFVAFFSGKNNGIKLQIDKRLSAAIPEKAVAAYLHMKDEKGREFSTDYFTTAPEEGSMK